MGLLAPCLVRKLNSGLVTLSFNLSFFGGETPIHSRRTPGRLGHWGRRRRFTCVCSELRVAVEILLRWSVFQLERLQPECSLPSMCKVFIPIHVPIKHHRPRVLKRPARAPGRVCVGLFVLRPGYVFQFNFESHLLLQPIADRVAQHLEIICKTFPTNQSSAHGIYD